VRILRAEGVKLPRWVDEGVKKTVAPKHADKLRKNQSREEVASAEEESAEVEKAE
jgi:hypothetical protein